MKIIPLKTGSVKVKRSQQSRRPGGMLNVLASGEWTEWLPIYSWLIKHPEGIYVVDTGETSKTSRPGYFPGWHPYYRYAVKFDVKREEEIDVQLKKHGVNPHDVEKVILTHFHTDHAGGLYHFPNSDILVPETDYEDAKGVLGQLKGYLPQHWRDWFAPTVVRFKNHRYGSFARSLPLTKDGSVVIVPTPGHTRGHLSVMADPGDKKVFLAGDTSYNQDLLLRLQPDGVSPMIRESVQTQKSILKMAESDPLVYLPSHDPDSADRLANNQFLEVTPETAEGKNFMVPSFNSQYSMYTK